MNHSKKIIVGSLITALVLAVIGVAAYSSTSNSDLTGRVNIQDSQVIGVAAYSSTSNSDLTGRVNIQDSQVREKLASRQASVKKSTEVKKDVEKKKESKDMKKNVTPQMPAVPMGENMDQVPPSSSTPSAQGGAEISFNADPYGVYSSILTPDASCSLTACQKIGSLRISAQQDALSLNKLVLSNADKAYDFSQRFGTFFLVDSATNTAVDVTTMNDPGNGPGTLTFDGFSYVINANDNVDLDVYVQVMSVNSSSQSGSIIQLYLANTNQSNIGLINGTTGAYLTSSDITNDAFDGGVDQRSYIVRRTKPSITYSNWNVNNVITGTVSQMPVYYFNVTADSTWVLEWKRVRFNTTNSGSGISSGNYNIYAVGNPTPLNAAPASINSNGKLTMVPSSPQVVPAGTTISYVLKADVNIINTVSSQALSIGMTAQDDQGFLTTSALSGIGGSASFVWSDVSATGHSAATQDWTNGNMVHEFDVETVNLLYQGTN